ncbi:MAG: hypothetical protein EBY40_01175 [Marivivens sp.]|nr:hypothetical protein [Marivivens sp.]NBT50007.1 hypothetical protein [Marivivens sp.]NCW67391.1 hypothetical protein [Marivivens sp.]NDH01720.1 hypothetical protein [Marivivens sp.]
MKPGIYDNMSYDEYHAIDAVRASQLKPYKLSARRGRHAELTPLTGRFLGLGNAIHTRILEPHEFDARYVVLGPCQAEMKSGARKGQACGSPGTVSSGGISYCGRHGSAADSDGRMALTEAEDRACTRIQAALNERPDILRYLDAPHHVERVMVWDDPDTGVACKCRIDHQLSEDNTIVDLKTTSAQDLKPGTLMKAVASLGYHIGFAWYRRGCRALGIPTDRVLTVWLQTVQDNDVAAYWMEEDALDQGEREAMDCLARLVEGRKSGVYPGVQTDCTHETIGLPEWAIDAPQLIDEGIETYG